MTELGAQTDPDFAFVALPEPIEDAPGEAEDLQATAQTANPLGNLAQLEGKWSGKDSTRSGDRTMRPAETRLGRTASSN